MKIADVLDKAADLIEPDGAWTDGWGSRDRRGEGVAWGDKRATCWSAHEAIYRVCRYASDSDLAMRLFRAYVTKPLRTQVEAVSALREAAAKAREQGL